MGLSRRICNDCGPPMPKDLNSFTIPQIKEELKKRGVGNDDVKGLRKAELVARLQAVLGRSGDAADATGTSTEPVAVAAVVVSNEKRSGNSPLTKEYILSLKVVGLKRELKARGKPVSGLKAALQDRLLADISSDSNEKEEKEAPVETAKVATEASTVAKKNVPVNSSSVDKENSTKANANCVQKAVANPPMEDITQKTEALSLCAPAITSGPFHWKSLHWKKTPPPPGAPEVKQSANERTFYWCAKCKIWTPSHSTVQHVKKKKNGSHQNKTKASKGPLAPLYGMPRPMYTSFN